MSLPPNWQDVLEECNFVAVKEGLSNVFELAKFEAQKQGCDPVYKVEMVWAWQRFAANPDSATAKDLLRAAPELWSAFETYGAALDSDSQSPFGFEETGGAMEAANGNDPESVASSYIHMANDLQKQLNESNPGDDLRGIVFDAVQMFKECVGEHEKDTKRG